MKKYILKITMGMAVLAMTAINANLMFGNANGGILGLENISGLAFASLEGGVTNRELRDNGEDCTHWNHPGETGDRVVCFEQTGGTANCNVGDKGCAFDL